MGGAVGAGARGRGGRWLALLGAGGLAALLVAAGGAALGQSGGGPPAGERGGKPGAPRPLLWRIEGETPSYLFGTIHLPDDRVRALPPAVEQAFAAAQAVYTEIPLDAASQIEAARMMALPGTQTLQGVLPPELYERTVRYIEARGLPALPFMRLKVWAMSTQVSLLEVLPQLLLERPLDAELAHRAAAAGKAVRALETVQEQVGAFEALTLDEQIRMHRITMEALDKEPEAARAYLEELVALYLQGEPEAVRGALYRYLQADRELAAKAERVLLAERDRRMAERIAEWLGREPGRVHLFAVGAAHLGGQDGIVARLRARGLVLERLGAAAPERRPEPEPAGAAR
ncbi:MAG: hypothetical protein KatS3mg102_0442 [Planctomycetota bacterium]|nr:MAG: hypothetical protein KatS3mg102_0442 [Planctomycetota bacterium]